MPVGIDGHENRSNSLTNRCVSRAYQQRQLSLFPN